MKFDPAVVLPPRVLLTGKPTAGKTGSIAQLANAGYRILLFDFDNNYRVIGNYLKPNAADIFVQTFSAGRMSNDSILQTPEQAKAIQQAAVTQMNTFWKQIKHWKTATEDLGPSNKLTPTDVMVIDSGTFLGELLLMAAFAHPKANDHLPTIYNWAGKFYSGILDYLTGPDNKASVLFLTHVMDSGQKDKDGTFIGKIEQVPVAVGEKISRRMAQYFTDVWHIEIGPTGQRQIKTAATDKMGLRTSAPLSIKPVEPFDVASMFDRLLNKPSVVATP